MPTISGLRRRGYTPAVDPPLLRRDRRGQGQQHRRSWPFLESCIREELNKTAPRAMAVLRPLKVVLTNYPEGRVEELDCVNNPEDPAAGTRKVPFSRELYIERDDFMENPPKKFFRLSPGREVRLRYAYFITCVGVDERPGDGRGRSSSAAPTIRRPGAATRPTAAARRRRSIGFRPPTPSRPKSGSMTRCSPNATRARSRKGRTGSRTSIPKSLEVAHGAHGSSRRSKQAAAREPVSVRAAGLFLRRHQGFGAGPARSSTGR